MTLCSVLTPVRTAISGYEARCWKLEDRPFLSFLSFPRKLVPAKLFLAKAGNGAGNPETSSVLSGGLTRRRIYQKGEL